MTDFMRLQIRERKEHVRGRSEEELAKDAFTMLVSANAAEDPKSRLDDDELVFKILSSLVDMGLLTRTLR